MGRASALRALERKLEGLDVRMRPPDAAPAVPTGVPGLDALLPRGGLPRGAATEWSGPRSCGKTALLRATLLRFRTGGDPVALVDAARTLHAPDWVGPGLFRVVRPSDPREAVRCVELLLRSGAFGAVAFLPEDPGRALSRGGAVRLQRRAEESRAVLLVAGTLPVASLRLRFHPGRMEPAEGRLFGPFLPALRPVWVGVGPHGREVEVPILCPLLPPPPPFSLPVRDRKGRR